MRAARLSLVFCAFVAFAQFPGQYPGQSPLPGGYPGGSPYPTGRRGPQQQQQPPQDSGRQSSSRQRSVAAITTEGVLRRASSNQVVIEPEDHRIIWYRLTDKTLIQKDGRDADLKSFQVADHLTVESSEDDDGNFIATSITWNKAGTREEQADASRTWDLPPPSAGPLARASTTQASRRGDDDDRPILRRKNEDSSSQPQAPAPQQASTPAPSTAAATPTAAPAAGNDEPVDNRAATTVRPPDPAADPDDPGKPVLRRGTPSASRPASTAASTASPSTPSTPATSPGDAPVLTANLNQPSLSRSGQPEGRQGVQPIPIEDDPIIQKARATAASFAGILPNFFCQQSTTRYQTDNPKRGWDAIDIVTADVAYENGRETYKNIKIGNKVVGQSMDELPGTRSTGEFATQLDILMHPGTGAIFRKNGQDSIRGRQAWVYKFDIPRERANWRIEGNSQLYYPAYRGNVWIDKETSRVLRIEQEAHNMPPLFQFDTVESSTDYDFVRLGTPEQYLLPVEAEVLSCERGTNNCSRNKMEFRNYRKFGAESSITFGDSAK
jgi:hypothetical protein